MELPIWSKCRKPVITAFCLWYGAFTIAQALPRRWPIAIFCQNATPKIVFRLGLDYKLILFSTQKKEIPEYFFRIHYPSGRRMDWIYPEPEFLFDKGLYRRYFTTCMSFAHHSQIFDAETSRYVARKFDTPTEHPVLVEFVEIIHTTPPVGKPPIPGTASILFSYPVTPQDLAQDADVAKSSRGPLGK